MKTPRRARGVGISASLAALAALGLAAAIATAGAPPHLASRANASHAADGVRLDAATSTPVTTTMGPISANSVALYSGPGYGYPTTTYAAPFTAYDISCFSAPGIAPGSMGSYPIPDMSTVWYQLTVPASGQEAGYILATDPSNQFSIANADIPDTVGRCTSDPPLPTASSSTGEYVSAAPPQKCASGILSPGLNTITVHSSVSNLDIEFLAALPVPMSVDVQDLSTGQGGSGLALSDPRATYHFTENQNTTFGDHTLSVNVDGTLGGLNGDDAPLNGDTIDGDVSWEVVSGGCIQ